MKFIARMFIFILFVFMLFSSLYSKARFMDLEELVAVSDVIAIIEVTQTEDLGEIFDEHLPKKGYWTYAQKNRFRFIEFIKVQKELGFTTEVINILWAKKSFICAQASYREGKFLVFLESIGDNEWITINHHLGCFLIVDPDTVVGFDHYRRSKCSETISYSRAKEMISNATLDGDGVTLDIRVDSALKSIYNFWRADNPFQKILFHRESDDIIENWPEGLYHFARGFYRSEEISKDIYEEIISSSGVYSLEGKWEEGYLYISSIKRKE